MRCINIPLVQTGQIHKLSADYISGNEALKNLYDFKPDLTGLASAIEKRKSYPVNRKILVESLKQQYSGNFDQSGNKCVEDNINSLPDENTFTITTGHQLNIFTGPLYFIYKIASAVSYAQMLCKQYPQYHFVPVYWMATEDHDLEEINHFHIWGKTLKWDESPSGATGRMNPHSMASVIEELGTLMSNSPNGAEMISLFRKAYLEHNTLADATRYIVNELFKEYGLVVVDGDNSSLKKALIPTIEKDIFENTSYKAINATIGSLQKTYKLPLSPREINVFHLGANRRDRIVFEEGKYKVLDSDKSWTAEELKEELHKNPENFSPNVVLRPMYQELILPNLAYVGGNSEIAYWLELKGAFDSGNVFFPQLLVRDSALIIGKKAAEYLEMLKLKPEELFLSLEDLKFRFYEVNELEHDSEKDAVIILDQYEKLRNDLQGLPSDLAANIVKQMNIQVKEVRKWKNDIHQKQLELQEKKVAKIDKIYASFYPEGELQERYDNFIPYYLQSGKGWIDMLVKEFNPLESICHIFLEE
jgi:bacillithiol biosynthesis cysteine-adding enzyme BshC